MKHMVWAAVAATVLASCGGTGAGSSSRGTIGGAILGVAAAGATIAFAGVGKPSGGKPVNKAEPSDEIKDPRHSGVAACVAGNAEQNLAIARAFEDSMHELVVCGGMAQRFSISFYDALINAARGSSTRPKAFRHVGGGRYQIGDVMSVSLQLPFETSFGKRGDPINFDVFDIGSYFADARIVVSPRRGGGADIDVRFSSALPGAELFRGAVGSGAGGGGFKIDFKKLVDTLGAVEMNQEINVDDRRGDIRVVYNVESNGVPIRNVVFASGGGAPLSILGAKAENAGLSQTLTVTDWNMAFSGGSAKTLDGSVSFEVRGGDFAWAGTFEYPHRPTPNITLRCLP